MISLMLVPLVKCLALPIDFFLISIVSPENDVSHDLHTKIVFSSSFSKTLVVRTISRTTALDAVSN